jgi:hypothetical protein
MPAGLRRRGNARVGRRLAAALACRGHCLTVTSVADLEAARSRSDLKRDPMRSARGSGRSEKQARARVSRDGR